MIYLDNAATTFPKPERVISAAAGAIRAYGANPGRSGHALSIKTAEAVYKARKNIAEFFGLSKPQCCIFTLNCTHAINILLKGVLRRGDHVIISELEHNAVVRPLEALAGIGVSYSTAEVYADNDKTVLSFEEKIKRNTKLIMCTQVSNVFGTILPIKRLSALAQTNGIMMGVDGAQGAGLLPLELSGDGPDFICVPAHKGLYGIMGCGALLMKDEYLLETLIEGGTGSLSKSLVQPEILPDRHESGTLPVPAICAFSEGVSFVRERGMERIFRHESELCELLCKRLEGAHGCRVHRRGDAHYAPVVSLSFENIPGEQAAELLSRDGIAVRAGLHCAPLAHISSGTDKAGTVRIAPSVFTTREEIEAAAERITRICDGNLRKSY